MPTLLAVDDDQDTLDLYDAIFGKLGYRVVRCNDAAQVPSLVKDLDPECVIMDLCMPDVCQGLAATQCIKSDPATCDVPVVVVTGKTDDYTCMKVYDTGASDIVTKPFDTTDIVSRVKPLITLSAVRKLTSKMMKKI